MTIIARCMVLIFCVTAAEGIKCYHCGHNQNIKRCLHENECPESKVCQTRIYLNDNKEHIFHYGCSFKNECTTFNHHHQGGLNHQIAKKFLDLNHQICEGCCDTSDGCNLELCKKYLPKSTTSPKSYSTPKPTTIHQHQHKPHVHNNHDKASTKSITTIATLLTNTPTVTTTKPTTLPSFFTATHYNGPACVDHEDVMISCGASIASQGLCGMTSSNLYHIVKVKCQRTCGFC